MTTKELIKSEIDNLDNQDLEDFYKLFRLFLETKPVSQKPSFMSKLKRIKIDATEDFSVNLDLYASGEKQIDPGSHGLRGNPVLNAPAFRDAERGNE